ncbi:MAG TPA: HAD-IA family hydrolase [Puia sp.]|jgi:FMN phosphatase YigB (HAD superfamily)
MNKKKITTLFLDIGGVLLSNGWGHNFRRLAAEKFHIDEKEMEERHGIMFATYEEGKITLNEYLERVIFFKQRDFTADHFKDFMFSLSTPDLEMISLIKKLKVQYGLKIVAVSNEARELNAHRIHAFKLNSFIDFFVSSCYVHLRKPDEAIFRMALDVARVQSEQVVYIEDTELFIEVAADLGIRGIQHKKFSSTVKALAAMGLNIG